MIKIIILNNSQHDGLRLIIIIIYDTTEDIILKWYIENENEITKLKKKS